MARSRRRTGPRSVTITKRDLPRDFLEAESARLEVELSELDAARPRTRADCIDGPRPCPWVACRHHVYLDVNPENGTIKIIHPDLDPLDMTRSCSLDVADEGEHTLEAVGEIMNVTRERARQLEFRAAAKLRTARALRDWAGPARVGSVPRP